MHKQIVIGIRKDRCTGCSLCQLACSFEKEGKFAPGISRIELLDRDQRGFYPTMCRNCIEAPCLDACPAGAISKRRKDGYVVLDRDRCIGCNMCIMVCPFNAIGYDKNRNYKCDTCDGLEKCIKICPYGAIGFGSAERLNAARRRSLAAQLTQKGGGKDGW